MYIIKCVDKYNCSSRDWHPQLLYDNVLTRNHSNESYLLAVASRDYSHRYLDAYNILILRAKSRIINSNQYKEEHHIVPRSLGGTNTSDNFVRLTAKEHYLDF